jgi:hypothetical protein
MHLRLRPHVTARAEQPRPRPAAAPRARVRARAYPKYLAPNSLKARSAQSTTVGATQ